MPPPISRAPAPGRFTVSRSGASGPSSVSFDRAAGSHQHGPLPRLQLSDLLLDVLGQGQVEIVAAEDQVVADGHAMELHLARLRRGGRESA